LCGGSFIASRDDGEEHPIAYASKKFSKSEVRMSATERELAAVVSGVKHFKHYLLGAPEFIVRTDHKSLVWLKTLMTDNTRITRWSLELEAYNFEVQHRRGVKSGNVDGISRLLCAVDVITVDELVVGQGGDSECKKFRGMKGFVTKFNVLYREMTKGPSIGLPHKLLNVVLQQEHESRLAAHRCTKHMIRGLSRRFWWKSMRKDIKHCVKMCVECAKRSRSG
jgi:hypothetical protein